MPTHWDDPALTILSLVFLMAIAWTLGAFLVRYQGMLRGGASEPAPPSGV